MKTSTIFRNIAFAFILITFHININQIDLLPNWIGYLLIYLAIKDMNSSYKTHLEISVIIFLVYEALSWMMLLLGNSFYIPVITILLNILNVYLNYLIFTFIIDECSKCNNGYELEMRKYRDLYLKLDIICCTFIVLNNIFINEFIAILTLLLGIVLIVMRIILIAKLFKMSNQEEVSGN